MTERVPTVVADAHARATRDVCVALDVDPARGLDAGDAQARLAFAGRNELDQAPPVPAWRKFLAQFESPLVLLLIAAGGIASRCGSSSTARGCPTRR